MNVRKDDSLFEALRVYAKENVVKAWAAGLSKTRWTDQVIDAAKSINRDLELGIIDAAVEIKAVKVASYIWGELPTRHTVGRNGTIVRK